LRLQYHFNDHYSETGNQRLINLINHRLIFIRPAGMFRNGLLFITININQQCHSG